MLTSERLRVVLDTSVVVRGLMAKKQEKKDSFSYKILRQFESNHFKLMMNSRIREEYQRKLDEHIKKGNINAEDANHFLTLVTSDKAHYDQMFITPLIDVVDDPTDNIFFLSGNCLTANYLVTVNSKHLNSLIQDDLLKLRTGLKIVNQAEFLGEKVKTKVYLSHSSSYDYMGELYEPLKKTDLVQKYNLIFPHDNEVEIDARNIVPTCDVILAEVSLPSTGQGIEMGWGNSAKIPIICFYKSGAKFSSALKYVTNNFAEYENSKDMINVISEVLSKIV